MSGSQWHLLTQPCMHIELLHVSSPATHETIHLQVEKERLLEFDFSRGGHWARHWLGCILVQFMKYMQCQSFCVLASVNAKTKSINALGSADVLHNALI